MTPVAISDAQARAAAAEILGRDPYAAWHGADHTLWLGRLAAWLDRWNDWVGGLPAELQTLLFAGLLLLGLVLLGHVVWGLAVALRAPAAAPRTPPGAGEPDLAAEAQALAAGGRFLEAAHRLQLACLARLVRQRRLVLSRFEPNRVLRRRVAEAALPEAQRRTLVALVDRLERGWFRDRTADAALYGDWRALYAALGDDAPTA